MQPDSHVVLDLCCGSGSGCVAAVRMGYLALGVDRAPEQVGEAKRRLKVFTDNEVDDIASTTSQEMVFQQIVASKRDAKAAGEQATPSGELVAFTNLDPPAGAST